MGARRGAYRAFVGRPELKELLEKFRSTWEGTVKF